MAVGGAGSGLALFQFLRQVRKDEDGASKNQDFVVDEKRLEEVLDDVTPRLLELVKVDYSLVAHLKRHGLLYTGLEQKLKNPLHENITKVQLVLDQITRHLRGRFLPLLLALEATHQTGAIAALDTKDIRDCLNLENPDNRQLQIDRDFNKVLEEGVAETCRERLVVLGRAGAGKTSVVKALLGMEFLTDHDITDILDIYCATIDEEGMWEQQEAREMRKYEENNLVAQVMMQRMGQTEINGSGDQGATARNAGHREVPKQQKQDVSADPLMMIKHAEAEPPRSKKKQEITPAKVERLLQKGKLDKKDSMHIWDFAGQLIYYIVHQLFITARTIFLLVTDGSRDLDAPIPPEYAMDSDLSLKTERDYAEYFLKTVSIWGHPEGSQQEFEPPHAFILLNKADLVSPKKLNERLEKVRKLVKETPAFKRIVRKVLPFTSNPTPDNKGWSQLPSYAKSSSDLKDWLQQVKQDFVDKVPIKWLKLKNKLQKNPHCSFEESVEIAKSLDIERDKVKSVLEYFHQHRELVYWDTEGLRDLIICQPIWLINEMRKIITVKENQMDECKRNLKLIPHIESLNDDKILHEVLAEVLWKKNYKAMIKIMQKYLLLLPWARDQFEKHQYLIPCLLEPMKDTDTIRETQVFPPIYFFLWDKVIPIGLTSRLLTLLATQEGWNDGDEYPEIFFNGAKFILKEKNTYLPIIVKELLWEPCVKSKWKHKKERMKKQTVIQVKAGLTEINEEEKKDVHRCLTRARKTIQDGIGYILSMINVSRPVVTAVESPCKHKLLLPETLVCNICNKSSRPELYACWFGEELVTGTGKQDMSRPDEFVHDEGKLVECLDVGMPYLLDNMEVDLSLIAELQVHQVLNRKTKDRLKMSHHTKDEKVDMLMGYIKRNTKGTFLPLLLALKATCQTRIIDELDTEATRRCLNLKHKERSLLDNLPFLEQDLLKVTMSGTRL